MNTKALALCGLALLGDVPRVDEARETVCEARAVTDAGGVVKEFLDLLGALAPIDATNILEPVREAALRP
jgi:hypothetical protein